MDESDDPRFQRVDWRSIDDGSRRLRPEHGVLLAGLLAVAMLVCYHRFVAHVYLIGSWEPLPIDWVAMVGVVVLGAYGIVPALRRPDTVARLLRGARSRRGLLLGFGILATFGLLGTVVPVVIGRPELNFADAVQPPLGFTAERFGPACYGETVVGEGITRYCQGSAYYPYGTNHRGHPMEYMIVYGARTAAYVVVFAVAFILPLATAVGVSAGLRGGRLDDLLMGYVDVQLCVPALFVYFIGYMYDGPSLLLLLLTFGLLSWGGIARLVRSEVLQRREAGHVVLARSLGASDRYLARRHILPNVTNTLVPAVFHLCAILVLAEAGVAFLGFSDVELYSWGSTIAEGLRTEDMHPHQVWWISTLPALALTLLLLGFKLAGDGLRDLLDPQTDS